jgi:hypothetical protein
LKNQKPNSEEKDSTVRFGEQIHCGQKSYDSVPRRKNAPSKADQKYFELWPCSKKPEDPFIMEDNGSTTLEFSENAEGKTVLQFTKAAVQCGVTLPPIDEKGIKAEN